jgi:hypothetical protein
VDLRVLTDSRIIQQEEEEDRRPETLGRPGKADQANRPMQQVRPSFAFIPEIDHE